MDLAQKEFSQRFASLSTDLGGQEVEALIGLLRRREVAAGEGIIHEGTPSDALYLVWEGGTVVRVGGAEVGRYGAGATMGEISFLDGGPATASVVTAAPTTLLWLDRATFESLQTGHPRIATCLLHSVCLELASRVRQSTDLLERMRAAHDSTRPEQLSEAPRKMGVLDAFRLLLGIAPSTPPNNRTRN